MTDIESQRAARRAAMPITSEFMWQYAEFAPKLIYARENGIRVGKPPQDENCFAIPPLYRMATNVAKVKR